jgi:hypothetical protein
VNIPFAMSKFDITDTELETYSRASYNISHYSNEKAFNAIPQDTKNKIKSYYQYLRNNFGVLPNKIVDGKMTYYEVVSSEEAWEIAKQDKFHSEPVPF